MFAARMVAKSRKPDSRRPATKKSEVPRTSRPTQRPRATRPAKYSARSTSWSVIGRRVGGAGGSGSRGEVAERRNAARGGCLPDRSHDGFGGHLRSERPNHEEAVIRF